MKGPQYVYNRKSLDNIPPSKLPFILKFKEVNLVQELYYPLLFLVTNISRSTGHVAIAYILLVSYWWVYLYILRNIIFIGMFYELISMSKISRKIFNKSWYWDYLDEIRCFIWSFHEVSVGYQEKILMPFQLSNITNIST